MSNHTLASALCENSRNSRINILRKRIEDVVEEAQSDSSLLLVEKIIREVNDDLRKASEAGREEVVLILNNKLESEASASIKQLVVASVMLFLEGGGFSCSYGTTPSSELTVSWKHCAA